MNWFKREKSITEKEVDEKIQEALGIKWLQSMQKLEVKDGDLVVVRYADKLSAETHRSLKRALQEVIKGFGFNVNVMLLEEGMEIGILRKDGQHGRSKPYERKWNPVQESEAG